jgi:ribokinase
MAPSIVVVGTINQDFVMSAERMPRPGETVLGSDLKLVAGGKAANQAVTAARLGADVSIIGRVGDDVFGPQLRQNLVNEAIHTDQLITDPQAASGAAFVALSPSGENSIISVPGANFEVTPAQIEDARGVIAQADFALVQFAIPMETVEAFIRVAVEEDTPVQVDPTPVRDRLPKNFSQAHATVPNETEAEGIVGHPVGDSQAARHAAEDLHGRGIRLAVVKLGADGCVVCHQGRTRHVPGFVVDPVDTTGCGDAFAAALAVAQAEGMDPWESARFANACGALAATVFGAQPSLPHREDVEEFLFRHD